ncbi:MAG: hypothetical protein IPQ07_17560 [Myxococcales bacterium]|nr:hypothetical protein [Myxococcales bacterium]
MVRPVVIVVALACPRACGRDHGSARVRPLPRKDGSPCPARWRRAEIAARIANYKTRRGSMPNVARSPPPRP